MKVYIVLIEYSDEESGIHYDVKSVWSDFLKAEKEIRRLKNNGYKNSHFEIDEFTLDKEEN